MVDDPLLRHVLGVVDGIRQSLAEVPAKRGRAETVRAATVVPDSLVSPSVFLSWAHQGPDWGAQYRSVIFFHSPEQEKTAKASKEKAQENFRNPIVTQVVPAETFWKAEDYHQQYLAKRGLGSCHI